MTTRHNKKPFGLKEGETLVLLPINSFVYQPDPNVPGRPFRAKEARYIDLANPSDVELAKALIQAKLVRVEARRPLDDVETR